MRSRERELGFVAVEWVLAVGLLLLPSVLLAGSLPVWAERRHAATVAAREAAAAIVRDQPVADAGRAELVAKVTAWNHGVDPGDIEVRVAGATAARGAFVTVEVEVRMPALAVPLVGGAGAWSYTARQHRRVDDYRSWR